ncbi:MAG: polysaccharide biosynthesis protein [Clostridia bacterium]|nr:polysaccharide biosynthesis protein [Clostridia bacterium]
MSEVASRNLKRSAAIMLFATILVKLIGGLFKLPLASDSVLGDLGFGYFSAAYDVFTPIHYIAISGFPVVIAKLISDNLGKNNLFEARKIFILSRRMIIFLSLICFVVYLAVLSVIYFLFGKSFNKFYSLYAIAPAIIFCFISSCYRGYFEGFNNMTPAAVSNIIEAFGKLCLGLGLSLISICIGFDISVSAAFAILGVTLGSLASAVYLRLRFNKERKDFDNTLKGIKDNKIGFKILMISLPIVLSSLTTSIMAFIDSLTVSNAGGFLNLNINYFASLISEQKITENLLPTVLYGIRSKAFTLFNLVPTLTLSIAVALIPSISKSFAEKNTSELKENIGAVVKITSLIVLPAGFGFIVFGRRIMELLYGVGASSQIGGIMLTVFGFAAIFAGFSLSLAGILQGIGKQNIVLLNIAIGVLIKILLNFILCKIESINILGAVYSTAISFFVIFILHFIVLIIHTGRITSIGKNIIKPLLASFICILISYSFSFIDNSKIFTVLAMIIAVIIYFVALIWLKCIEESDFYLLPSSEKLIKISKKFKIIR